jgi:hypothetical protein
MKTQPPFKFVRAEPGDVPIGAVKFWVGVVLSLAALIGMAWGALQFSVEWHDRGIESTLQQLAEDSAMDRCQKAKRATGATFEVAVKQCLAENPRTP